MQTYEIHIREIDVELSEYLTWRSECDKIVAGKLGVGIDDLPDGPWRDNFDDGLTPEAATDCVYEDVWRDDFSSSDVDLWNS